MIWLSLSRNDKINPKTERNPCKLDYEDALLNRSRAWPVGARSLLLTGQTDVKNAFSKLLKNIEKFNLSMKLC